MYEPHLSITYADKEILIAIVGFSQSLSLIHFVKIRLPDFLCKEFPIKMHRLLQNYTFAI